MTRKPRAEALKLPAATELAAIAIIRGEDADAIEESLKTHGAHASTARAAVKRAIERVTLAANVSLARELGLAIEQLREVYKAAIQGADASAALAARRELNKLLDLYNIKPADLGEAEAKETALGRMIAEIEEHLRPLAGVPDDYPLVEVARIVADKARRAEP